MTYPAGVTETQFLEVSEQVVNALLSKFDSFAYFGKADIAQEIRLYAWQALPHFKPEAGALGSYLYRACKNHLLNTLRAFQGRRNEPGCAVCHAARQGRGPGHPDGVECKFYKAWCERNRVKAALARPHDITVIPDEKESRTRVNSTVVEDVALDEILRVLDEGLDADHRRLWLQAREGVRLSKDLRQQMERAVVEVLLAAGLTLDDLGLPAEQDSIGVGDRGSGAADGEELADEQPPAAARGRGLITSPSWPHACK